MLWGALQTCSTDRPAIPHHAEQPVVLHVRQPLEREQRAQQTRLPDTWGDSSVSGCRSYNPGASARAFPMPLLPDPGDPLS